MDSSEGTLKMETRLGSGHVWTRVPEKHPCWQRGRFFSRASLDDWNWISLRLCDQKQEVLTAALLWCGLPSLYEIGSNLLQVSNVNQDDLAPFYIIQPDAKNKHQQPKMAGGGGVGELCAILQQTTRGWSWELVLHLGKSQNFRSDCWRNLDRSLSWTEFNMAALLLSTLSDSGAIVEPLGHWVCSECQQNFLLIS